MVAYLTVTFFLGAVLAAFVEALTRIPRRGGERRWSK